MADRRHFLSILTGLTGASLAAACAGQKPDSQDEIERALEELIRAAGIGIVPDDFELARAYAAGAYREAARSLRPLVLDSSLDFPVAFAAKRGTE